jgi:putative hemolysin
VAGFIVATLGHLPALGDRVVVEGHRLEVLELDGRRIARVGVAEVAGVEPPTLDEAAGPDQTGPQG